MFNKILLSLALMCSIGFASLKQQTTTLQNVSSDTATINIGNLTIGQTGVIIHNFDEAKSMLMKVKALGYKQACIVKGTISIQY